MVLCYSRLMYVEFTVLQTMAHFLACHQHAFEAFGGVPQTVMVDNLKSAVLKRMLGQEPMLNPKYANFADHMGFTIAPGNVAKGNEKGRVENGVGYVKKNFLAGLDLPPLQCPGPCRQALARYGGQCAHPWRNPPAPGGPVAQGKTVSGCLAASSL